MSTLLSLSITFLDDLFHGQGDNGPEWPPSPQRVYQATLCAAARNGCDGHDEFQWFEALSPPDILAPATTTALRREFFVPNNDADVSKKFDRQLRLTGKVARPTRILGDSTTVRYLWPIRPEDEPTARKIIHHAQLISAVGWGIDLVVANGQLVEIEEPTWSAGMRRWTPATGGKLLRCPVAGTLHDLREVYDSFVNRVDGKFYKLPRRPSRFREVMYRTSRDHAPGRPGIAFKLLEPDDDTDRLASFDARHAMHVAAWLRGRACKLARSEATRFLKGYDSEQYVAGHVSEGARAGPSPPRLSYLPVPTIGHRRADGRIRRVIVAEPYGGTGDCVEWARQALSLKMLTDSGGGKQAQLLPLESDGVLKCYKRQSRVFETVTPVLLPGHDGRSYKKAQKLMSKAIEQAGFSRDDVESVYLQKAPFFPGAYHPREYVLPQYLKALPHSAMHARITWKHPIHGPLAIGAGRYLGLGLFAAIHEE